MDKRKATEQDPNSSTKQRKRPAYKEVAFSFDDDDSENGDGVSFQEEVSKGGHYRSSGFWISPLIRNLGSIQLRPALNDYSDACSYYMRRINAKNPDRPSYIELPRKYFPQLKEWLLERFAEHDGSDSKIELLKKHPEVGHLRVSQLGLPENFFKNGVTLQLDQFRIRPYFDERNKLTVYYVNNERSCDVNPNWPGPTFGYVPVGEMKRLLAALTEFEEMF